MGQCSVSNLYSIDLKPPVKSNATNIPLYMELTFDADNIREPATKPDSSPIPPQARVTPPHSPATYGIIPPEATSYAEHRASTESPMCESTLRPRTANYGKVNSFT